MSTAVTESLMEMYHLPPEVDMIFAELHSFSSLPTGDRVKPNTDAILASTTPSEPTLNTGADNEVPSSTHMIAPTNLVSSLDVPQESRMSQYLSQCENVETKLNEVVSMLSGLETQHQSLSDRTCSLHETCNKLLEEQSRLTNNVTTIRTPLEYFQSLDDLGPILGLPLPSALKDTVSIQRTVEVSTLASPRDLETFRGILDRIDACVDYMDSHSYFRDAPTYAKRFRQLRLRAISLLRGQIIESMQASAESVLHGLRVQPQPSQASDALRDSILANNTYSSLLYVRYRALGKELRPLIAEIEKRSGSAFGVYLPGSESGSGKETAHSVHDDEADESVMVSSGTYGRLIIYMSPVVLAGIMLDVGCTLECIL